MYVDTPGSNFVDMVRCDQKSVLMPKSFATKDIGKQIWEFKPRPDDVWVITYPKCGTTMTQELIWQMINLAKGGKLDSEKAKEFLFLRTPFLEMTSLVAELPPPPPSEAPEIAHRVHKLMSDQVAYTTELESPRVIKTHLPISMLNPDVVKTCKIIVVMRNPKDAAASMFHHERLLTNHNLKHDYPFDDYANGYTQGKAVYGDYFEWLKDALKQEKNEPNIKMVWFEDMKKDLESVINDIGDFIGHKVPADSMASLLSHMHIDNFRKNDAVNMKPLRGTVPDEVRENHNFIRKGVVGDGKSHFKSAEVEASFDDWVNKNNKDEDGNIIGYTSV